MLVGGKGRRGGWGRNPVTTLISWLLRGEGRGEQANLVLDFSLVLITFTVPPLVSLSPISRSAGRPLSIKNKSRWSEHQLHSGLCYCTALFLAIFQLYFRSCYCTALFPTFQLYSQPCYCTALSWPCYCSALFLAISSFIPDCIQLLDTCGSLPWSQ